MNAGMGGAMDPTTPQSTPTSWWGLCMACMRLETYKRYFDIDTEDIRIRMMAAMTHFHQPQYFRDQVVGPENPQLGIQASAPSELKGPDLYGPVWITFVLILLVAVRLERERNKMWIIVFFSYFVAIFPLFRPLPIGRRPSTATNWTNLNTTLTIFCTLGVSSQPLCLVSPLSFGSVLDACPSRLSHWPNGSVITGTVWSPFCPPPLFASSPLDLLNGSFSWRLPGPVDS